MDYYRFLVSFPNPTWLIQTRPPQLLAMVFLMPDNMGFFDLRRKETVFTSGLPSAQARPPGEGVKQGVKDSPSLEAQLAKSPLHKQEDLSLDHRSPHQSWAYNPPLWVGWQQRVLQLCWPVSPVSQSYTPLKEVHRVSKSARNPV